MCGLVGYLGGSNFDLVHSRLTRMADKISHRGPDAYGSWYDSQETIAIAHRRLSILDLTEAGAQPMASVCGKYIIAFNGEIYNHLEIRNELNNSALAPSWRGHSDTETLLAGFSAWGLRATIERCVGMFAFAVWDRANKILTLARDRLGEKPLYYGWQGTGQAASFVFGSELSALKTHPEFVSEINRDALCLMMRHSSIAAPHSIYKNIFKLPPGHILSVSLARREPAIESYWSFPTVAERGVSRPFVGTDIEAVDQLEILLRNSVRMQMLSDVPVGAFLSGGIDSSTIVALMQEQSIRPIKTFTIGFSEEKFNEALYARQVAKHIGTDHTELYVTPKQALDIIPRLPDIYSEPFADSSQIPTYLVSQLAREQVTVVLSGDAGDELFCGYSRYMLAQTLWNKFNYIPAFVSKLTAAGIHAIPIAGWNTIFKALGPVLPNYLRQPNIGDKLHKGADIISSKVIDELYFKLITNWNPNGLVIGGNEPHTCLNQNSLNFLGLNAQQRMMALDTITYLPDEILVKVDRAAMNASLETRAPFLDHRIVEFAWTLPHHLKLREGVGKWALRQILNRYVPSELFERPKMGFGVPIDIWLRGPLLDWAENLLDESRLKLQGYLNANQIRNKWLEHVSGKRNWQYHLWPVLMFQAWLEVQDHN